MAARTALVDTSWLADHLEDPDVAVVDASWYLPNANRDAHKEHITQRIPGSVFFDIDEISDKSSGLPHMMAAPEDFAGHMRRMGLGESMRIVVYDSAGLFSAARVWWTFSIMGHSQAGVLNGGLPKWIAENRPLASGPPEKRAEQPFTARLDASRLRDGGAVRTLLESGLEQVLDARPGGRFSGIEPEPRPELSSGHMPGSLNLHYARLINEDGTLRPPAQLRALLDDAGVDFSKPVITSCGSGVTAAILSLALCELGHGQNSLYDGSWTDWASTPGRPIATR